jgi:TetR/AcrR family transcriptional repressor of nem operon
MKTQTKKLNRKEDILEKAQGLMLQKGFEATSVDEICSGAGVTKGSFFYYFKSKEDLGKALVSRFSSRMAAKFGESVCECGEDPLDRINGVIDCAIESSKEPENKGCLLGTFTQELYASHPDIRQACCDSFQSMIQMLKKDFALAKAKYAPKKTIDPQALAETLVSLIQGGLLLKKATQDRKFLERTLTQFKGNLDELFKK